MASPADRGERRRADARVVLAARVLASAVTLGLGFRAVSDDDYARAAIAASFAHAPRLDPTGTSWLPLPFWCTGAVERLLGRSLLVARGASIALGLACSLLLLVAARWLARRGGAIGSSSSEPPAISSSSRAIASSSSGASAFDSPSSNGLAFDSPTSRRAALLGAVFASIFAWSARLGVATVPELPAATLAVVAMASAATSRATTRCWGALAISAATLCRYEPWPIAAGFAALCGWDAARARGSARRGMLAAGLLSLAGPLAWMLWNHHAHGDALHFVARVTAYKQALGEGGTSLAAALADYPLAAVVQEPELFGVLAASAIAAWLVARGEARLTLRRHARPLALTLGMIAVLTAGAVRDAAPTHHPERALLAALLLVALLAGDLVARAFASARARSRARLAALLAMAASAGVLVRLLVAQPGAFAARDAEVAIGVAARERTAPGDKVLVEIADQGYWAFIAAMGRPEDAVVDRTLDPREPLVASSFDSEDRLRARLRDAGAKHFAGRRAAVADAVGGEPLVESGGWALWAPGASRP